MAIVYGPYVNKPQYDYMRNHCKSQHNGENIALGISDDNDDLSSTKATLILEQGDKDWLIISLPVNPRLIRFSK